MIPVLAKMERRGIKIDRRPVAPLRRFAQKAAAAEAEIKSSPARNSTSAPPSSSATSSTARWGSPAARRPRPANGRPTLKVLEELAARRRSSARKIVDWRQLTKLNPPTPTRCRATSIRRPGRVHTDYALASTSTGRLSSSSRICRTSRSAPRRAAPSAAPSSPRGFQARLRRLQPDRASRARAHGRHPAARKAFDEGLDIHAMTASEMFGVPVEGMDPTCAGAPRRSISASSTASPRSGSRPSSASRGGEAADYITPTSSASPASAATWIRPRQVRREPLCRDAVRAARALSRDPLLAAVAARLFQERAAINAPIQGSAADIIRRAMIRMEQALEAAGLTARMLLQVHDELVFEVPDEEVDDTIPVVRKGDGERREPRSSSACRSMSTRAPPTIGKTRIRPKGCFIDATIPYRLYPSNSCGRWP